MNRIGLLAVIALFLFCGCEKQEPRSEPKFGKGQKVIHRATDKECYVINPTYEYDERLGWTCAVFYYITQEELNEWEESLPDVGGKHSLDIDGGKLKICDHTYESMLEPAEDDYRKY